jgi:hypothetical protein
MRSILSTALIAGLLVSITTQAQKASDTEKAHSGEETHWNL